MIQFHLLGREKLFFRNFYQLPGRKPLLAFNLNKQHRIYFQNRRGPQKHKGQEEEREGKGSPEGGASGALRSESSTHRMAGSLQHPDSAPPRAGPGREPETTNSTRVTDSPEPRQNKEGEEDSGVGVGVGGRRERGDRMKKSGGNVQRVMRGPVWG